MALYKSAQFYDINDNQVSIDEIADDGDVVLYDEKPSEDEVLEMHSPEETHHVEGHPGESVELVFKLPELPGSLVPAEAIDDGTDVEVDGDEKEEEPKAKKDKNDADEEVDETDPWTSWKKKGPKHFINWSKDMLNFVPKHNGETAGLHRADAFLEKFLKEMQTVIRNDLMGDIDIAEFEHIRSEVEGGSQRLKDELKKRDQKAKKKSLNNEDHYTQLVKEAQRAAGISGIVVTVPLIISTIARTAINSMVSSGKDIEKVVGQLIKQFDLNKREQAELVQHLMDCNVTIQRPRCLDLDKDWDRTSSDNLDYSAQYSA